MILQPRLDLSMLAAGTLGMDRSPAATAEESDVRFVFSLQEETWMATYRRAAARPLVSSEIVSHIRPRLLLDVTALPLSNGQQPKAAVIRLLPETSTEVDVWQLRMNERMEEARESIRREGVMIETWFSFHLGEHDYLFAYMQPGAVAESGSTSDALSIDLVHREFKKTWDRSIRIQCEYVPCR